MPRVVPLSPYEPITPEMWARLRELYPDDYVREVAKAMSIAVDEETCRALLRGESVPASKIRREQARRYGRR